MSRAIRVRSAVRAWAMRMTCSRSAVATRSRREASRSRRAPMNAPAATKKARLSKLMIMLLAQSSDVEEGRSAWYPAPATSQPTPATATWTQRRWVAREMTAIPAAPMAVTEKAVRAVVASAIARGHRRRADGCDGEGGQGGGGRRDRQGPPPAKEQEHQRRHSQNGIEHVEPG